MPAPKVFISYAREDIDFKKTLETIITPMKRQGLIEPWHDGLIQPGELWNDAIRNNLNEADIVICLLSRDFLASEFINQVELPPVFQRHKAGTVKLIPIVVRPINLGASSFGQFQCIPLDNAGSLHAVSLWSSSDLAWVQIDKKIRAVVKSFENTNNSSTKATATQAVNLADLRLTLKRLMVDDIKKAMDELDKTLSKDSDIFNSLIQLQSRYNRNKKNAMMGLSTAQHTAVEEARITNSLQYLIEELRDEDLA